MVKTEVDLIRNWKKILFVAALKKIARWFHRANFVTLARDILAPLPTGAAFVGWAKLHAQYTFSENYGLFRIYQPTTATSQLKPVPPIGGSTTILRCVSGPQKKATQNFNAATSFWRRTVSSGRFRTAVASLTSTGSSTQGRRFLSPRPHRFRAAEASKKKRTKLKTGDTLIDDAPDSLGRTRLPDRSELFLHRIPSQCQ